MADKDQIALHRLLTLTLMRLVGFGVVITGMWLASSAGGANGRMAFGITLALTGLVIFLLVPRHFARKWRN